MSETILIIITIGFFKIVSLFVGLGFGYMGYRLFMSGIWGNAGNLETKFKDGGLVLRQAAPGTFFALFGALIIACTIIKGFSWDHERKSTEQFTPTAKLPDNPPF